MRTRALALLLIIALLAGVIAYLVIYFLAPAESPGMGRGNALQRYVWVPIAIVPIIFSVDLLAYLALFPDIERKPSTEKTLPEEQHELAAVLKVLKEDERKVVELLIDGDGTMLQRDIARKTGFSRVKTHRILYRLATRGIVTAAKYYNTYQIALADWLLPKKGKAKKPAA